MVAAAHNPSTGHKFGSMLRNLAGKPIAQMHKGIIESSNSMLMYRENGNITPLVSGVNLNIMQASAIKVFESHDQTEYIN